MKLYDVYEKYQIMPQLATHMLRVAGVGKLILGGWKNDIDYDLVLRTLLLHDMGNIIKFDLESQIIPIDNIEYWRSVQKDWLGKYGSDVHSATTRIVKELNQDKVLAILEEEHSVYMMTDKIGILNNSWPAKILAYCDVRVTPSGIGTMKERIDDLQKRYGRNLEWYDFLYALESDIKMATNTDLDSITEELAEPLFDDLLTYTI